jgi:hypothetical protein
VISRGRGLPQKLTVATSSLALAAAAWLLSVRSIALEGMGDYGLIALLPATTFLSVVLTAILVSYLLIYHTRSPATYVGATLFVVLLHGTAPIAESTARFAATWRHAGIIDYIAVHRSVDTTIDAYFNWPGFFSAFAFISQAAGIHSVLDVARWASPAFMLLLFPVLLHMYRSADSDLVCSIFAATLCCSLNWVNQDYFSPQTAAFYLYLVVLAVLLRWFSGEPVSGYLVELRRGQRPVVLLAAVLLLVVALVPTHQLTPFALLGCLVLLVLARQCQLRTLPIFLGTLIFGWMTFMAFDFLSGNLPILLDQIGDVRSSVNSNVTSRAALGSAAHQHVVQLRQLATALVWMLAALGVAQSWRRGERHWFFMICFVAPFSLVAVVTYGGEVVIRAYMLSLPFACFFIAKLVLSSLSDRSPLRLVAMSAALSASALGFFVIALGNERTDYFTPGEVDAVQAMYRHAQPGAVLMGSSQNLPWRSHAYASFDYMGVDTLGTWLALQRGRGTIADVVRNISEILDGGRVPGYIVFTKSANAYVDTFEGPRGAMTVLQRRIHESPRFDLIYQNSDAAVFSTNG